MIKQKQGTSLLNTMSNSYKDERKEIDMLVRRRRNDPVVQSRYNLLRISFVPVSNKTYILGYPACALCLERFHDGFYCECAAFVFCSPKCRDEVSHKCPKVKEIISNKEMDLKIYCLFSRFNDEALDALRSWFHNNKAIVFRIGRPIVNTSHLDCSNDRIQHVAVPFTRYFDRDELRVIPVLARYKDITFMRLMILTDSLRDYIFRNDKEIAYFPDDLEKGHLASSCRYKAEIEDSSREGLQEGINNYIKENPKKKARALLKLSQLTKTGYRSGSKVSGPILCCSYCLVCMEPGEYVVVDGSIERIYKGTDYDWYDIPRKAGAPPIYSCLCGQYFSCSKRCLEICCEHIHVCSSEVNVLRLEMDYYCMLSRIYTTRNYDEMVEVFFIASVDENAEMTIKEHRLTAEDVKFYPFLYRSGMCDNLIKREFTSFLYTVGGHTYLRFIALTNTFSEFIDKDDWEPKGDPSQPRPREIPIEPEQVDLKAVLDLPTKINNIDLKLCYLCGESLDPRENHIRLVFTDKIIFIHLQSPTRRNHIFITCSGRFDIHELEDLKRSVIFFNSSTTREEWVTIDATEEQKEEPEDHSITQDETDEVVEESKDNNVEEELETEETEEERLDRIFKNLTAEVEYKSSRTEQETSDESIQRTQKTPKKGPKKMTLREFLKK